MRLIPYPLRAARISLSLCPFGFWWKPEAHKRPMTESAKQEGALIWWCRWAWFQIEYSRWV